jgi:hypothetical protein
MHGFSLFESASDGKQHTKEDVPGRIQRVACNSFSEPLFSTLELSLLLKKVAEMSLDYVARSRWAESKCATQGEKSIVVTSKGVPCQGEFQPSAGTTRKVPNQLGRQFYTTRGESMLVSSSNFLEPLLEIVSHIFVSLSVGWNPGLAAHSAHHADITSIFPSASAGGTNHLSSRACRASP